MMQSHAKYKYFWMISIVWIGLAVTGNLHADIFTYIDSQGVIHFSNVPTSPQYKVYIKERSPKPLHSYTVDRYDRLITAASEKHDIDFSLLKALIKIESDFNPRAVSPAGAKGLMQLMPENIKTLQIKNPFDPWENSWICA